MPCLFNDHPTDIRWKPRLSPSTAESDVAHENRGEAVISRVKIRSYMLELLGRNRFHNHHHQAHRHPWRGTVDRKDMGRLDSDRRRVVAAPESPVRHEPRANKTSNTRNKTRLRGENNVTQ